MKPTEKQIRDWIVFKLSYKRVWGKRHISETNLTKPYKHMKKEILKQANNLVTKGILVRFPHTGEMHYYLNPNMSNEIREIVKNYKLMKPQIQWRVMGDLIKDEDTFKFWGEEIRLNLYLLASDTDIIRWWLDTKGIQ